MRFRDKVCLVTGGGSGIGRATCLRFAQEGADVAIVDVNEKGGKETVDLVKQTGRDAIFAKCDVGESEDVQAALKATIDKWQKVDVIVNDAAIMTFDPIVDLPEESWDKVMRVNMRSVFLLCKYGVRHMPDGGAIVNISSVHAHETTRKVVPYASSKGAMEAFTRGFSEEMEDRKIRVNCVAPGAVNTPMLWNNPNIKSGEEKVTGAVGEPEDVAAAIAFLASDEARFINGTTLVVDGGRLNIL
ncbi:MAG: glucose 1-dehydrogenase [Fimbriimonadaceae bacterium]|jgi:NAD(P)-dependent dehydrogenase (short-subunit alcohol dehydrogenase family)|nr:glucose 1-dehydrogenase [Fimbriimonadaceae bacterium]